MKLLVDTVNNDLYVAIIENNKTIAYEHLKDLKRKSDALPEIFDELTKALKIKARDLKEIYVVNGPGSFMGIRAGMTFCKTMALVTGAKLFGIDNLTFISAGIDGEYFVDAKGNSSYKGTISKGKTIIELTDYQEDSSIDYDLLINDPEQYLKLFKLIDDIPNYECLYIKEPQVGGA